MNRPPIPTYWWDMDAKHPHTGSQPTIEWLLDQFEPHRVFGMAEAIGGLSVYIPKGNERKSLHQSRLLASLTLPELEVFSDVYGGEYVRFPALRGFRIRYLHTFNSLSTGAIATRVCGTQSGVGRTLAGMRLGRVSRNGESLGPNERKLFCGDGNV